ncbi:uncharacterized protein LOC121328682 isoform X1 [Polyodon spathula]|uniref:uncharacterized protein LOC121328682 isoform X1 n=1 Tax=Polyodon spathula TaxID=7913 RepID=UPI001B7F4755|nr:uncharacterized protein LOC121328682 isoform X1 [Polyodon spathula]
MFHYCLAHTAYHLSRRLPRHGRLKFQVIVVLFVTVILAPQLYVLLRPKSARFCQQPLLNNLTCFIVFTLITTGFTTVLTLVDPVPQEVKAGFHVYGVASFAVGLCTTVLTARAPQCAKTTPELYYLSLVLSVCCMLSTAFFLIIGACWIANKLSPGLVLDKRSQTGFCYQPVSCCSCLWHV